VSVSSALALRPGGAGPGLSAPAVTVTGMDQQDDGPDGPGARYADLVHELAGESGVTTPPGGSGFGRSALRYQGKIFAMLVRGRLVLKLPAGRVEALVAAGAGEHFDANKGTPMREWLSLDPESAGPWLPLANEALGFARAARR
jgi:hypothetical protein